MSAPHRYDLVSNSCVSNGVEKFNRKLCKRLKRFGKLELIDVVSERNLFTDLYKIYKITNDLNFRNYYKSYTKILSKVIKAAKKSTL